MGFRTLEISRACEIHIRSGQMEIAYEEGSIQIPVEDLEQIMVHGAGIRLSTMDLSILTQNRVALTTLDEKYLPTAIVLPFEGHARQSKLMHAQVNMPASTTAASLMLSTWRMTLSNLTVPWSILLPMNISDQMFFFPKRNAGNWLMFFTTPVWSTTQKSIS